MISFVKLSIVNERPAKYDSSIASAKNVADIVRETTLNDADESFFVVSVDARNRINSIYTAGKGAGNSVAVCIKDALRAAIVSNATAIITVHNHPSGHVEPSREDLVLFKRFRESCELIHLNYLDSVIVGNHAYWAESNNSTVID